MENKKINESDAELLEQLRAALLSESETSAESINVNKINSIMKLIDIYEGTEYKSVNVEKKLTEFNTKYGTGFKLSRLPSRRLKYRIALAGLITCMTIGFNIDALSQIPKSIFEIINTLGNIKIHRDAVVDEAITNKTKYYSSWSELAKDIPYNILVPVYIPERFKQNSIQATEYQDDRNQINCNYSCDSADDYLYFAIRTSNIETNISLTDSRTWTPLESEYVKSRKIQYFQYTTDEETLLRALFEHESSFYSIEGEITLDELKKIISLMEEKR